MNVELKRGALPPAKAPPPLHELPPEQRAPLAAFAGQKPPAPAWFDAAMARAPERSRVETPRGGLELLTWGEVGKPGLMLVHGNFASADWWTWVAPYFADDYRVAAVSLAGMGGSDWREAYMFEEHASDIDDAADAAGLSASGAPPVYAAHSFGGGLAFRAAARDPSRTAGVILIDGGFRPPAPEVLQERIARIDRLKAERAAGAQMKLRSFPDLETAVSRFRLLPPQPVENLFILDQIARAATKRVEGPGGPSWSWRHDPELAAKIDYAGRVEYFAGRPHLPVPAAHLFGEHSWLIARGEERAQTPLPDDMIEVEIPDAHHHVMIDQPLAMVAAMKAVLAGWRA